MALTLQDPHKAVITTVGFAVGGGTASSTKPVITGTADAGATVDIFDGVRMIGTAIAAANGTWSFAPTADLKAGSHSFTAISVDKGDMGASSTPMSVTVPGGTPVTPAKPVIDGGGPTDDTGHPLSNPTNYPRPEISGTGTPGDTITMYDGNTPIGSTIIDSTGHWHVTPSQDLGPGSHDIYVIDSNWADLSSLPSDHFPVVIDANVPAKPSIPTLTDDSGATIPAGSTTADAHPHINGTGKAGDIVTVFDGAAKLGTATVDADGKWSFTPSPPLSGGSHSVSVTESNAAGTSAYSAAVGFTTSVPVVTITGLYDFNHSLIPENGSTMGPVTIEGTASGYVDGDKFYLFFGGPASLQGYGRNQMLVTVVDGKFSVTVDQNSVSDPAFGGFHLFIGAGTFTVTALIVHADKSANTTSAAHTITDTNWIGMGVPSAPTLTDDTGANIPAGGGTSMSTPHISGTGQAGETITVYDGATVLGTATVGVDGKWSFTPPPLSSGSHSISVTESNATNTSVHSTAISFSTAVAVVTITGLYDHNHNLIPQNGSTTGPVTIEGMATGYADGDRVALDFSGPASQKDYSRCEILVTIVGGKFSATVSKDTKSDPIFGGGPLFQGSGSFEVTAMLLDSSDHIYTTGAGYTITDTNWTVAGVQALFAQTDNSSDHAQSASVSDTAQPAQQTSQHTVVGEHDAFVGKSANGNETVDLNADPSAYFKEVTAHIQGGGGGVIDTLHLMGDHQVLDLTSLTGKTAAAKISGIEVVDLGGQHNTLKVSLADVLNLGETDLFQKDGKQQMMVQGKEGDTVDLSNTHIAGVADGEWAVHGTTQVGGVTYNVYEHSGAHTELLVQQGVQIVVH